LLDETKAQYFILENVPGLLSSNQGKDMAAVLEALVEHGYRVAYRVLDAQHFGVPQRRRRVFIIGSFGNSGGSPEQILAIAEGRARYIEASKQKRENLARKIATGFRNAEWWNGKDVADTLTVSSNEQRMPDKNKMQMIVFSPHREDGARVNENVVNTLLSSMGTGGNNVPMVFPMHGAIIGAKDENGPDGSGFLGENDPSYTLTASGLNRHGVAIIHNPSSFADYTEADVVGTLRAGMPAGSEPLVQGYKKNLAEKDEEQWMETDVSRNISVFDNNHESRVTVLAQIDSVVRRLTPVECERLQGFPDDWTSGQADSSRYKQMGNAVAVPVVEWIVKRLVGVANE
jgi:DNA (cytosine-5)-methyltransferase 1